MSNYSLRFLSLASKHFCLTAASERFAYAAAPETLVGS